MFENLANSDSAAIKKELTGLLDTSQRDASKFIKEFIERVEGVKAYQE